MTMGYSHYLLDDGRAAGYGIEALCDSEYCFNRIDRGLGWLCGANPNGWRDPDEWGCGGYFCAEHGGDHDCPNPDGGAFDG